MIILTLPVRVDSARAASVACSQTPAMSAPTPSSSVRSRTAVFRVAWLLPRDLPNASHSSGWRRGPVPGAAWDAYYAPLFLTTLLLLVQ